MQSRYRPPNFGQETPEFWARYPRKTGKTPPKNGQGKTAQKRRKPLIHRAFSHLWENAVYIIDIIDNIARVGLCLTHGRAFNILCMSQYENARNGTGKNSKHSWSTATGDSNSFFLYRPKTGKKQHIKRNPQTERGDNPKMRARASPKTGINLN